MVEQVVVGIDVSKAKLDVAILPSGESLRSAMIALASVSYFSGSARWRPAEWCWKQPANLNSWRSVSWLPPGCR